MVYFGRYSLACLLLTLAGSSAEPAAQEQAEKKMLEAVKTWKETVGAADQVKTPLRPACITDATTLAALYKDLKLGNKVPEVDFKTEVVLYYVTPTSNVRIQASLSDKGDLVTLGVGNRDFVPGLRCVFTTVKKDGIKSVNGNPLQE